MTRYPNARIKRRESYKGDTPTLYYATGKDKEQYLIYDQGHKNGSIYIYRFEKEMPAEELNQILSNILGDQELGTRGPLKVYALNEIKESQFY